MVPIVKNLEELMPASLGDEDVRLADQLDEKVGYPKRWLVAAPLIGIGLWGCIAAFGYAIFQG